MERNVTMAEISDGKLYSRDDMVKAGCDDCRGCSACCHGMGNSIVLDPYDVYRLTALRGDTLEHLYAVARDSRRCILNGLERWQTEKTLSARRAGEQES